jgi:hypothetical protein
VIGLVLLIWLLGSVLAAVCFAVGFRLGQQKGISQCTAALLDEPEES